MRFGKGIGRIGVFGYWLGRKVTGIEEFHDAFSHAASEHAAIRDIFEENGHWYIPDAQLADPPSKHSFGKLSGRAAGESKVGGIDAGFVSNAVQRGDGISHGDVFEIDLGDDGFLEELHGLFGRGFRALGRALFGFEGGVCGGSGVRR